MIAALLLLMLYLLILMLICIPGLGIGFLLHWAIPAMDVGTGTLIGVIAISAAAHFFLEMMASLERTHDAQLESDWSETGSIVLKSLRPRRTRRNQRKVDQ
jgi:hypothetical protein